MPSQPLSSKARLSRRQMMGAAGLSALAAATPATAQEKAPMPTLSPDPRIALLEAQRSAPLTPQQLHDLPAQLKDQDDTAASLRKFSLADGDSEPATRFSPLP